MEWPSNRNTKPISVKSKHLLCSLGLRSGANVKHSFEQIAALIKTNGGKIADLAEPKLTHVIVDKRDISRRLELMRLTSK